MTNLALTLATALLFASQSFGYTQVETFKVSSPNTRIREAAKAGLVSNNEAREKRDVIRMKSRHPSRYRNTAEFPNKYMNEIESGLSKVEPAKSLANLYIVKAVENNWSKLRDSAFLDSPTSNLTEAKRLIKKELEHIVLVDIPSKTQLRFEIPWASVLVRKDLKEVRVTLRVASHLDGNKLPEGAESIQIPEDN
jgi:hypothetical protein